MEEVNHTFFLMYGKVAIMVLDAWLDALDALQQHGLDIEMANHLTYMAGAAFQKTLANTDFTTFKPGGTEQEWGRIIEPKYPLTVEVDEILKALSGDTPTPVPENDNEDGTENDRRIG